METVLRSASRELRIGGENPFCIVGERINPTGRKIFQEQLRRGDLSRIEIDVAEQVAGGAMMLDVNMGAPLADEAELMVAAVKLIQGRCDLPLCLDSSIVEVLEAGLAAYQGKALVNSVTAEDERLDAILPLVRRHGAAVIALPNDEEEIPEDPRRRLELVRKIVDVATGKYGIPLEDIVIDPLAMPVGADTSLVLRTLETIALVREEFGLNMTLGASNVSFGMPDRASIGSAFLPMAITSGLTSAIMDARSPQLVRAVKAADLLTNKDPWGASWIAAHRAAQAQAQAAGAPSGAQAAPMTHVQRAQRSFTTAAPKTAGRPAASALPAPHAASSARVELVFQPSGTRVRVPPGVTLFDAASWNGIAIDSTCGGHGTCKKCKIRIAGGGVPASPLDARAFSPDELRDGWRLACRAQAATRPAGRGPAAGHQAEGGHGRGRPPGHPAPGRAEALPGAGRAVPVRPADRHRAGAGRPRRPGAAGRPGRCCGRSARCCARPTTG